MRTVSAREVYRCSLFSISEEEATDGKDYHIKRSIIRHQGSAVMMAVDEKKRVLLVRQYRHAVGGFLWELVAGHIERGERALAAARRELLEETGFRARRFERWAEFFPTPGFLSEKMVLFRATGLRAGRARPEADEALEARAFSRSALRRLLRRKQLRDGKTLIGVLLELGRRRA